MYSFIETVIFTMAPEKMQKVKYTSMDILEGYIRNANGKDVSCAKGELNGLLKSEFMQVKGYFLNSVGHVNMHEACCTNIKLRMAKLEEEDSEKNAYEISVLKRSLATLELDLARHIEERGLWHSYAIHLSRRWCNICGC